MATAHPERVDALMRGMLGEHEQDVADALAAYEAALLALQEARIEIERLRGLVGATETASEPETARRSSRSGRGAERGAGRAGDAPA